MVESGAIDETLADLRDHGVVYEADGAVWLRTTDFGDDKDRVLVKSDGEPTYLLPDIAYHRDKFARGFELLIDVWGADHHGYVPRLKVGVQALGHDPDELEIILGQLVDARARRRAGPALQAGRRHRAARRPARRGRPRRRPAHVPAPVDRHPPDLRPRPRHAASRWRTPSSTCSTPTPASRSIGRMAAETGRRAAAARPRSTCRCSTHERELDVLRSLSELPDVVAGRLRRPGAAQGHHLGARAGRRASTASTTTAT